ncbi:MAG: protein-glutamate O-methyltransferase CheR, partial [Gemmatimonadetes bacterium]|nr:protein-glutamate O-methyltransferase CheR [Gemmatimonadota bacterium]
DRGFVAPSYKGTCLRRRIAVRMRARGQTDYAAYGRLLDQDPAEYERLLDALTINVTKLYRNSEAWHAVREQVLPELWALPTPRLRGWVAGCSSGEEAYTLAALWHAYAAARHETERLARLRIVATDIDRASLEAAAAGRYDEAAFAEMPAALRERYFGAARTAAPELRALLDFRRHDMLREAPPNGPYQLITCRNVIIYFDRASQEGLLRRFHDALAPGGLLVLGKVETLLGPARALFEVVDQRQRIFRRV